MCKIKEYVACNSLHDKMLSKVFLKIMFVGIALSVVLTHLVLDMTSINVYAWIPHSVCSS